jgi:hypothetical protein
MNNFSMNNDLENNDTRPASVLEQIRAKAQYQEPEKKILSAAEKKAVARERILFANFPHDGDWYDDSDSDYEATCPICGAKCSRGNEKNLKLPWLGLGMEEHCWECGAEPEDHDPFYQQRFNGWKMYHKLEELIRVENIYCSNKFMTRDQIAMNRKYFGLIVAAINSAIYDHWPDRHQSLIRQRQSKELYERLIQLATQTHGGDESKALNEYGFMSREIEDLYTIIGELEAEIYPISSEMKYKEQHRLQHPSVGHNPDS